MVRLNHVLEVWGTPAFAGTFKQAVQQLETAELPLQQGLARSSYVSESERTVVILNTEETPQQILVKAGIFYAGIIAGSCCSDDPTPMCEESEYCEVLFSIDRETGNAEVALL